MANLQELIPSFFVGPGGKRLTPEQIKDREQVAQSLLGRATDTRPDAGGWASVLTKGLLGYQAGRDRNLAESAGQQNATESQSLIQQALSGLGSSTSTPAYPASVAAGGSSMAPAATGVASAPSGADAATIKAGLIQRGIPDHIADGFLMNFQDESGLNPGINEANPTVPGSRGGFGLYQLTGPRRVAYENFAQQQGVDPSNVDAQLDFLKTELAGPEANAAKSIFAAPDAGTAAAAIARDFLRPSAENLAPRLAKYISAVPATGGAEITPTAPEEILRQSRANGSVPYEGPGATITPSSYSTPAQQAPAAQAINAVAPTQAASPPSQQIAQALQPYPIQASARPQDPMVAGADQTLQPPMQQVAPTQQMGGINPAIIQALSSPYATPQAQQIASSLLNNQMQQQSAERQAAASQQQWLARQGYEAQQKQADPLYQAQLQIATQKGASGTQQPLINAGNGNVYDPNTGKWITAPTSGNTAPKLETLFDDATGLPYKGQWNPDTKKYDRIGGNKAPTGMSITTNPDGTVSVVQGGVGGKALTEGQSKDTVFATRASGALPIVDELGDSLTNLKENLGGKIPIAGNYMKSPEYQKAEQAGTEFLQAILRKDTGAAITPQETDEYGKVYLPRPGDSAELLAQKKASRTRAVAALEAGIPAQGILQMEKALAKTNAATSGAPQPGTSGAGWTTLPNGVKIRQKGN